MLADLVEVTPEDGIALGGAYFAARGTPSEGGVDGVCFFHGDSGHFYRPLYLALGEYLSGKGIAVLSANRRGHDTVANGHAVAPQGVCLRVGGRVPAGLQGVDGAAVQQGPPAVGLGGHSGGAVRAVYAQPHGQFDEVSAVLAVSPGEYDHAGLISLTEKSSSMRSRRPGPKSRPAGPTACCLPDYPGAVPGAARPSSTVSTPITVTVCARESKPFLPDIIRLWCSRM
ncbi:MAG: hypothetical protein Ct9H300mP16_04210 [Pseudomonadota bacterium]|nr:MAG: hypothetical protein Ct9H300mP16_04210 [Pseudomonadota bacterium]